MQWRHYHHQSQSVAVVCPCPFVKRKFKHHYWQKSKVCRPNEQEDQAIRTRGSGADHYMWRAIRNSAARWRHHRLRKLSGSWSRNVFLWSAVGWVASDWTEQRGRPSTFALNCVVEASAETPLTGNSKEPKELFGETKSIRTSRRGGRHGCRTLYRGTKLRA